MSQDILAAALQAVTDLEQTMIDLTNQIAALNTANSAAESRGRNPAPTTPPPTEQPIPPKQRPTGTEPISNATPVSTRPDEILRDMSGKIWGALQTVIPKGWSMDQFGNWIDTTKDLQTQLAALASSGALQGPPLTPVSVDQHGRMSVPSAVPAAPAPTAVITPADLASSLANIRGSVFLDGRELFSSFVQFGENIGLVMPQS